MSIENGPLLHSFSTSQPGAASANEPAEDQGNTTTGDTQPIEENINSFRDDTVDDYSMAIEDTSVVHAEDNIVAEDDEEDDASGTSVLPLSRIKKIFKTDPEHVSASEAAVFTTAVATELFIQYFTEQASLIARSEKRKKLQYKDFSSAVSNIEQLHFLADTVPKTYNLKRLVDENKVKYSEPSGNPAVKAKQLAKGQSVLDFSAKTKSSTAEQADDVDELPESDDEQDIGEGGSNLDNDQQHDKDTDDDTDEEIENSHNHIRKDKDHDVIMG